MVLVKADEFFDVDQPDTVAIGQTEVFVEILRDTFETPTGSVSTLGSSNVIR